MTRPPELRPALPLGRQLVPFVVGLLAAAHMAASWAQPAEPAASPRVAPSPAGTPERLPERVQVPSLDRSGAEPVQQPGFWFAVGSPNEVPPRPALVLLHGCGGPYARGGQRLSERMREYAAWLNGLGIHVLVTDSLTPRGERELCTQRIGGRRVTQVERRRDALGALKWLAAQPGVDPARVGLLGWSHGGSAVLAATNAQHPEVQRAPVAPSLAVAFYPGCSADLRRGYEARAPLLLQIGEDDDWTPAEPCRQLAAQARGAAVTFDAYPGAVHGFDGTAPVSTRRDVPNGVRPGQGVRVGGQAQAREASRGRLEGFLRERWDLGR